MSCYHPLTAFWTGNFTDSGKKQMVIIHGHADLLPVESPAYRKYKIKPSGSHITYVNGLPYLKERFELPCGKCIGCRLDYSRDWALRCVLEARKYSHNYFVTLTYDNDHLLSPALYPAHFTKFIKDLRRYFEYHFGIQGIRFFASGEYGDKSLRPHYHVILFNCAIPDLKPYGSRHGQRYFVSDILNQIWKRGMVIIGDVSFDSCAYVARYVMKKRKGKDSSSWYTERGITPEFVRMSRRNGIGRDYFDENKADIYSHDEIFITDGKKRVMRFKPSRYYDYLYDLEAPEDLARIKEQRRLIGEITESNKCALRNADRYKVRLIDEELKSRKVLRLVRNKI